MPRLTRIAAKVDHDKSVCDHKIVDTCPSCGRHIVVLWRWLTSHGKWACRCGKSIKPELTAEAVEALDRAALSAGVLTARSAADAAAAMAALVAAS